MKALKIIFKTFYYILIVSIFLIIFAALGFFFFLNSNKALNLAAMEAIERLNLDIKYEKIYGDFFSGIGIKGFNYQNKVKGDLYLKSDFNALRNGILKIDEANLTSLWIDEKFLKELLKGEKKEKKKESENKKSFLKEIDIKNINFSLKDFKWDSYKVDNLSLNVKNLKYDMNKKLSCVLSLKERGNVGSFYLLSRVNLPQYRFSMDGEIREDFINPFIKANKIFLKNNIPLYLKGEGDFNRVSAFLHIKPFKVKANDIEIISKKILCKGDFDIKKHFTKVALSSFMDSDIAKIDLNFKTSLNIDDLNNTLKANIISNIETKKKYIQDILKDSNITLIKPPKIFVTLKGDMRDLLFNVKSSDFKLKAQGINIWNDKLYIDGDLKALKGDFKGEFVSLVNSDVGVLDIKANADGNIKDLNNTLKFDSKAMLFAKQKRIKNKNISLNILKNSILKLNLAGDMKEVKGGLLSNINLKINGKRLKAEIEKTKFYYSLLKNDLKANSKFKIGGDFAKAKGNVKVFANLKDLNSTLNQRADIEILKLMKIKDINLVSILPLKISSFGKLSKIRAKVSSPKFSIIANSYDLNRFDYKLKTKDLNISKIYTPLSDEILVKAKSHGFYVLSKKYAKIETKIDKFILNKEKFHTNSFLFKMKEKDFSLNNFKIYGKDFWVSLNGKKRRKDIKLTLFSPGISFKEGKIKDIKLDISGKGDEKEGVLKIKKAEFELKDFKSKEMNKKVSLKRDGLVEWKGEDAKIDIDFGDLLKFYAIKRGDNIDEKIKIKKLYLSYEDFGHTTITSNISISQKKKKVKVLGGINFYDTLITYTPKFLSISEDKDIVIITKKDKTKRPKKENKNFLKNVAIDFFIKSKDEMIYKNDDAEISFKPDLKIEKEFNKPLKLLGKIKVIEGYYDLADKRFLIQKGAIAFRGQKQINPLLDLHIKYDEIEDVLIFIDIRGDAKKPRLVFRSKPPMPKKDILSYLSFGMSTRELKAAGSNAKGAAEKIFSKAVSKDLAKALNLDRLSLSRNKEGSFDVKAGKKLNKKTIIYYQNKRMQSSFIYERKLSDRWRVDISGGQEIGKNGVGTAGAGIDFYYEKSFK